MSVCDIPVISSVCDAVGEGAATLVSAPFDWLAATMGQAAGWLIESMWTVFDSTTLVDVQSQGYLDVYNLLFGIGVFIVLLFFCFQLILGLIRREPAALSRAALGAAKAVLGSFVVITLTATALEIVDGSIALVRWRVDPNEDGFLQVTRRVVSGPEPLQTFDLKRQWGEGHRTTGGD